MLVHTLCLLSAPPDQGSCRKNTVRHAHNTKQTERRITHKPDCSLSMTPSSLNPACTLSLVHRATMSPRHASRICRAFSSAASALLFWCCCCAVPSDALRFNSDFQLRPPRTMTSDGRPRSVGFGLEGLVPDSASSMESCRARIFSTCRRGERESLYRRIPLDSCGVCEVRCC